MAKRTNEQAQETRNRILHTTEKVFIPKGVSTVHWHNLPMA
jgi:AcrR family transcriptional regulator